MGSLIEYSSIIWEPNSTNSSLAKLDDIQKTAVQVVTIAFQTLFLYIAESEVNLLGVSSRFY